ncbi:MAG: RusA family crossover junction endodeoxyribonuclease [Pseudomonadota bacterium]|nr:RusA family crossover junction endodeoxyribonuclease [Pseudomonadota bacterium]
MSKKKIPKLTVRDYYDGGLIHITDVEIPSKRVGYKKEGEILIASVPFGARQFEERVREEFLNHNNPAWPMSGRLFMAIGILMPKSAFSITDVDNLAKTLLDAFCGIAYHDDKQIESLFVNKSMQQKWSVWIGLHTISHSEEKTWLVEPLMLSDNKSAA